MLDNVGGCTREKWRSCLGMLFVIHVSRDKMKKHLGVYLRIPAEISRHFKCMERYVDSPCSKNISAYSNRF